MSTTTIAPWKRETVSLLRLALPVVVVQVGVMLMGVVDTVMVGRMTGAEHDVQVALAAVALGNICVWFSMVVPFGCLMALDPLIAQALGSGDRIGVTRGIQRGLVRVVAMLVRD